MMDHDDLAAIVARITGLWGRTTPWSDPDSHRWIGRELAGYTPQQISRAIDEYRATDGSRAPKPAQLIGIIRTGRDRDPTTTRPHPDRCPGHVWGIIDEYDHDGRTVRDAVCVCCLLERRAVSADTLLVECESDARETARLDGRHPT
ncbi:MAG: hypothetical protein GEU73_07790 [Chloroflexi bacterium]|nr:hypothetical protein [Chloroflexota bacterium]